MKQRITEEQWDELNDAQKAKMEEFMSDNFSPWETSDGYPRLSAVNRSDDRVFIWTNERSRY